jgi:molybdate transport system regulatory protein
MELLEHIRQTGSISAAGRAMDMSYRRAWLLVSEMNRMFKQPVVESQRGGQKGGGAVLTAFGEELLNRFRQMEQTIRTTLADDLAWLEANRSPDSDEVDQGSSATVLMMAKIGMPSAAPSAPPTSW